MKSVLEELYYGNIRPFANRRNVSIETQKLLQTMEKYRKQFLDCLTEEQLKAWERYENCLNEIISQSECDIFIDGFCLGTKIIFECMEIK